MRTFRFRININGWESVIHEVQAEDELKARLIVEGMFSGAERIDKLA
jgi:hypothetical protein